MAREVACPRSIPTGPWRRGTPSRIEGPELFEASLHPGSAPALPRGSTTAAGHRLGITSPTLPRVVDRIRGSARRRPPRSSRCSSPPFSAAASGPPAWARPRRCPRPVRSRPSRAGGQLRSRRHACRVTGPSPSSGPPRPGSRAGAVASTPPLPVEVTVESARGPRRGHRPRRPPIRRRARDRRAVGPHLLNGHGRQPHGRRSWPRRAWKRSRGGRLGTGLRLVGLRLWETPRLLGRAVGRLTRRTRRAPSRRPLVIL